MSQSPETIPDDLTPVSYVGVEPRAIDWSEQLAKTPTREEAMYSIVPVVGSLATGFLRSGLFKAVAGVLLPVTVGAAGSFYYYSSGNPVLTERSQIQGSSVTKVVPFNEGCVAAYVSPVADTVKTSTELPVPGIPFFGLNKTQAVETQVDAQLTFVVPICYQGTDLILRYNSQNNTITVTAPDQFKTIIYQEDPMDPNAYHVSGNWLKGILDLGDSTFAYAETIGRDVSGSTTPTEKNDNALRGLAYVTAEEQAARCADTAWQAGARSIAEGAMRNTAELWYAGIAGTALPMDHIQVELPDTIPPLELQPEHQQLLDKLNALVQAGKSNLDSPVQWAKTTGNLVCKNATLTTNDMTGKQADSSVGANATPGQASDSVSVPKAEADAENLKQMQGAQ